MAGDESPGASNEPSGLVTGSVWRSPSRKKGAAFLQAVVVRKSVCLRKLSSGRRAVEVGFGRFLANAKVTVESLVESWSDRTAAAARGRHVLAIQDTSDIHFATSEGRRRGLGKVKTGNVFGLSLHAMLGVDADSGACLGLVGGKVWTRGNRKKSDPGKRPLAKKESRRWIDTARMARKVLCEAAMITVVGDREEEFFAAWAKIPGGRVHLLTRLCTDHALVGGTTVRHAVGLVAIADRQPLELRERANRKTRKVELALRFGTVLLKRPHTLEKDLPESLSVSFVEVIEQNPPKGSEPVHWLLLTTHKVETVADAWRIVGWYKQRWIIEQFFRVLKSQGLQIEDSDLQAAKRLERLVAVAAKAAAIIIQLVQARDRRDHQPADLAFNKAEIETLAALNPTLEGNTLLQKNPHPPNSLTWAAWIIAKLGGWDGYKSSRPPGPITFYDGLTHFRAMAEGWALRDVCMP
jgi:hypothetical protein